MNLAKISDQPLTMSHLEIAKLAEKRTDSVKRTVENLVNQGVITTPQIVESPKPQGGAPTMAYMINQRDSYVVMAQVNPAFTGRLVDRWMELENSPPKLPQTKREWIEFALEQEKKLELAAPKVAFVENLVERDTLMTATQVAQKHEKSAIWLNKVLVELNVYSKTVKRGKVFKQWFVDKGYGKMKQNELGYSQALFTPAGEVWISERLYTEGVL